LIQTCPQCGIETLSLTTFNGLAQTFDLDPVVNPDAPDTVRWYVSRKRGAVPATLVSRPDGEPFLMVHECRQSRQGAGDPVLTRFEIAHEDGPRVRELPLESPFTYQYRWPPSYAHVVIGGLTLCGARVRELDTERERERLQQMHVCPTCQARYPERPAALLDR